MNKIKKYIFSGFLLLLICKLNAQQLEIFYQGTEPLWLCEQHQFVWDKQTPLVFKDGKAVCKIRFAPKIMRLASVSGFSSLFFADTTEQIKVTVLRTHPLQLKIEGDRIGQYWRTIEKISRHYERQKSGIAKVYNYAYQENDQKKYNALKQKLQTWNLKREKRLDRTVHRAKRHACPEQVLLMADMPLDYKKRKLDPDMVDLYTRVYTPAYAFYNAFYPYVWGRELNILGIEYEQQRHLTEIARREAEHLFYRTACNRATDTETLKDIRRYAEIIDPAFLYGIFMEIQESGPMDLINLLHTKGKPDSLQADE